MSVSMLCSQCGAPAERCERCHSALCARRLCAELHEASCAAVSALPAGPLPTTSAAITWQPKAARRPARERDEQVERAVAEELVVRISRHRQAGRDALLAGECETAFDELTAARRLEPDLDRLGAAARRVLPTSWELETDLTPLARALSARRHPRAAEAWRLVLDDAPARSIQAEAAEWLARQALEAGHGLLGLRRLHAASRLGRGLDVAAFQTAYKQVGIDPAAAFALYLAASRLDAPSARAAGLRDPLTQQLWSDQDPRWWLDELPRTPGVPPGDHQLEALHRAGDLAHGKRDQGWLLLAEGDAIAASLGVRALGRDIRAGCAETAEHDAFVRIRAAYEGAVERLPEVAWPWYRLAELLAWAGFAEGAREHLLQAERRGLGPREADRAARSHLRALVQAGLGKAPDGLPTAARPFPSEPFAASLATRLGLRLR